MTIEAEHYEETRLRLMKDPIVQALAEEIPWSDNPILEAVFIHKDDGSPTFEFMLAVNKEYRKRGGKDGGHIGAIAEAIIRICKGESK